ncbi:hypothetical protein SLS58_008598 [Diplodia intermedia]|uniref:Ankyrin repeat protein n=1 Tax=Diplodia intermedia TaxID=856260 RepID=A0ABR3THC1_9PEZI
MGAVNNCNQHLEFPNDYGGLSCEVIRSFVELLVPYSDLSMTDQWGLTPMDYAIYNKNGLAQIELLQAGADYIERPEDDLNLLLWMAFDAEKFEAMETLFNHGADELQTAALVVCIN